MAWLLVGKTASGDLLHISEAARGEACSCYCPFCDRALAAKKGNVKVHHFAHIGQTCAFSAGYDFFQVESEIPTTYQNIVEWSEWKLADIANYRSSLLQEIEEYGPQYDALKQKGYQMLENLEDISQPANNRKERSKVRQANYQVMLQLKAFLEDHNAALPNWEKVRDTQPYRYARIVEQRSYRHLPKWNFVTGYPANQLWQHAYKDDEYTPEWLAPIAVDLNNNYQALRRKVVAAKEKLAAFEAEWERFKRFRLYFLLLEVPGQEVFFKIGITSRPNIMDRIKEITWDVRELGKSDVVVLYELSGYAFLESYFKKKYRDYCLPIKIAKEPYLDGGYHTEYFRFSYEPLLDKIRSDFKKLWYRTTDRKEKIKSSMQKLKEQGKPISRPADTDEKFLLKPKSQEIARLIGEGKSLREVERITGCSINTVRKVAELLKL